MARKKKCKSFSNILFKIFFWLTLASVVVYYVVNYFVSPPNVFYPGFQITIPPGYVIHGIDVSRYQSIINWKNVKEMKEKNIRIGFVFIKATEGISKIDPQFRRNWLNAEEQNIPKGAYHFFIASRSGKKQAANFIQMVDYEKNGEEKVIAALIYPKLHISFEAAFKLVKKMSRAEKTKILDSIFSKRSARWYKVPRAFEAAFVTFDMVLNNGAWRDLHRHRMLTQYRQRFSVYNGYDIPKDLEGTGLEKIFVRAIEKAEKVFKKIERKDKDLAQYAVTMAHKVRFLQKQNLRAFFWQSELRTTSQGHPDYRLVEQEKAKLIKKIYPLLGKYLMVDFNNYDFARRGTVEKIEQREKKLLRELSK